MSWKLLGLSGVSPSEQWFFKFALTAETGYEFFLTDLSHVWTERVDTLEKLKSKCHELQTPLDPEQSDSHTGLLLSRIQLALQDERPGDATRRMTEDPEQRRITIHLSISLEDFKLVPLEWKIYCSRENDVSIRSEIVYPLVRKAFVEKDRVNELLELLAQKDRVISKLVDRLEATGIEMDAVFPTVKNMNRERAAQHIRGLGIFNGAEWMEEQRRLETQSNGEPARMFQEITLSTVGTRRGSGSDDIQVSRMMAQLKRPYKYTALSYSVLEKLISEKERKPLRSPSSVGRAAGENLAAKNDAARGDSTTDGENESGQDLDLPPQSADRDPQSPPDQEATAPSDQAKGAKKKLGMIGGRRHLTKDKSPDQIPPDTALEPPHTESSPFTSTKEEHQPPKKKGKLGVIGGRRKALAASDKTSDASVGETMEIDQPVYSRSSIKTDDRSPGGQNLAEESSKPRESSQERANRKREELRQQLETEAPAKKKKKTARKF